MSKPAAKSHKSNDDFGRNDQSKGAVVTVTGTTLNFNRAGDYTIEFNGAGHAKIQLDGGHSFVIKAADFARITTFNLANANARLTIDADVLGTDSVTGAGSINITGVSFTEAGPGGRFEPSHNLDNAIGSLLTTRGVAGTIAQLSINGTAADAFKAVWDHLDDPYVDGGDYYNGPLNEAFARLGIEYALYLDAGGEPLTDITAKFTADGADAGAIPDREQSMHDNLLGNIATVSIQGRNFPDALEAELIALVPPGYGARGVFSGNESALGGADHDSARAFDYDRGWDRPDYLDRNYDALIDPRASQDRNMNGVDEQMFYGTGNTIDDWNVVRHEGAGVELGLKIKHRGGDEYAEASIDADGIAHYEVVSGPQPGTSNRAEWNFDFAATRLASGDDESFSFALELDIDPTDGVEFVTIYSSAMPLDTKFGDGSTFQNSSNLAFFASLIDTDPDTPGVQGYALGEGEFNIRLSAFDGGGELVASNEVVVHVVDATPAIDAAISLL